MIKKIDHIAVAVKDAAETLRFYSDALGIKPTHVEELPDHGVRVTFLPIGETNIKLLEPIVDTSQTAKFIESKGEGLHHICLGVDNIVESLKALTAQGVSLIDKEPRRGRSE